MQNKSKRSAVRSLAAMVLFLLIAIGLVVELLRIYVPNVWAAFSSGDENALQACFDGQNTAYSAGLLWLLSFVQILSVVLCPSSWWPESSWGPGWAARSA